MVSTRIDRSIWCLAFRVNPSVQRFDVHDSSSKMDLDATSSPAYDLGETVYCSSLQGCKLTAAVPLNALSTSALD